MTTLVSWAGIDNGGISSLYLASDSRFTFGTKHWDYGQKIFSSSKYPEMMGYCGDVLLSINIISVLLNLIDSEIIFLNTESPQNKIRKIFEYIEDKFKDYTKTMDTTIVYIIRHDEEFFYYEIYYSSTKKKWEYSEKKLKSLKKSSLISAYGSGKSYFEKYLESLGKIDTVNTSRHYYNALYDILLDSKDKFSGGAPQISVLYRGIHIPKNIGIVFNSSKYYLGAQINGEFLYNSLEWRNENFERVCPDSFKLLKGAQRQPRPKGNSPK